MSVIKNILAALMLMSAVPAHAQVQAALEEEKLKGNVKSFETAEKRRWPNQTGFGEWQAWGGQAKLFSRNGLLLQEMYISTKGPIPRVGIRYNADTTTFERIEKDDKGKQTLRITGKLNAGKRISEQTLFDSLGKAQAVQSFYYGANNRLMKIVSKLPDGREYAITELSYEAGKLPSRVRITEAGKRDQEIEYSYDSKGNLTRQKTLESLRSQTFDEKGSVITERTVNGLFKPIVKNFGYEYDAKGNWIKQIEYDDKKQEIGITEREIIYY